MSVFSAAVFVGLLLEVFPQVLVHLHKLSIQTAKVDKMMWSSVKSNCGACSQSAEESEREKSTVFPRHSMARPGNSFRASWVMPSVTRQWKHSIQVQDNTVYRNIRSERSSVMLGEGRWCIQEAESFRFCEFWINSAALVQSCVLVQFCRLIL